MKILEVQGLTKEFGGIKAVKDVNLSVRKDSITGIIGPNGAGKTTFFNLLTGIYTPSSGKIIYHLKDTVTGKSIQPQKMPSHGIARTFQNIRLFKEMTVLENVLLGNHPNLKYSVFSALFRLTPFFTGEEKAVEEAMALLRIFNLADKCDEKAKNLPYGDQRRLEIARAMASKPSLLLLDEPAAGMNPQETKELTELIKWVKETFQLSVILIEHDMSLVMNLCDDLFVFDYGNLIAQGTPAEIQVHPEVIKAYLGGENIA
ncbi:MAG: ABC transporter ATP-binding protein [Proteiniclasticum sp.]|nr:ABC transporter ATP-binding protein [Proteiniclasticum sp.]